MKADFSVANKKSYIMRKCMEAVQDDTNLLMEVFMENVTSVMVFSI